MTPESKKAAREALESLRVSAGLVASHDLRWEIEKQAADALMTALDEIDRLEQVLRNIADHSPLEKTSHLIRCAEKALKGESGNA